MTEQLARKPVKSKHFRWMEGMLVNFPPLRGAVGQQVYPTSARLTTTHDGRPNRLDGVIDLSNVPPGCLPDLTDPATLGCLLHLVREAWGDAGIAVQGEWVNLLGLRWFVEGSYMHGSTFRSLTNRRYATEAEALVAALEAAS